MDLDNLPFNWSPETGFDFSQPSSERPDTTPVEAPQAERPSRRAARPQREESQFDGDLKQEDLLEYENLNTIRAYMTDFKGVQYRDMAPEEVVDDFMEHMRFFNTNLVSTGGVVRYISRASDEQKARAAAAYELYDQLGNVFVNDGFFGAVEGVGEYIQAAALDPSNYLGLLTGGISKAGSMGITAGSRALVRQAMREASERALANGATREAAEQAGQAAANRTIQRLTERGVANSTADRIAGRVAQSERNVFMRRAAYEAERDVMRPLEARARRAALYGTTALDGTAAAINDFQIQNVMLDVGVQEQYSATQTAFSSLFGLVGGGLQLAGRAARGSSRLGDGRIRFEEAAARADQERSIQTALTPKDIDWTTSHIKQTITSWEEKVARGTATFGEDVAPVDLLYEIMLGADGKGGLAQMLRKKGVRITRNRLVSDVMTDVVAQLPARQLKEINEKLEPLTGITLGETTGMGQRLSDLFAKDINRAGRTLNVLSQVKKTINGGVVHGSNMLDAVARRDDVTNRVNTEMGKLQRLWKTGQYSQSIWRRLLVSSPATSMVNVAGYAQFSVGQTVADMFNAGGLMLNGLARGGNLTKSGRESLRMARVYGQIQAQKMRNFADPFTTHDTYMALLDQNKELKGKLFESFTGGVDRNIAKFNLDPNSKGVRLTESITDAANRLTGVRIQDTFTKSQMFITELDKALRLNKKTTLEDVMSTGLLDDIFDDDIINPALDATLKSVYSKNYTTDDQMANTFAKIIENVSAAPIIGTVLPFGRFLNNTVATVYQWGPLSLFPTMARILKRSNDAGEKLMAREAFARAAVGTTGMALAWQYDQERQKDNLAWNEIKMSDGTIIDAKNTFPYSYFLAIGRAVDYMVKGEPVPSEITRNVLAQVGVGQAATDLQFGNDMIAAADAIFSIGSDQPGYANMSTGLMRGLGNYFAGYSRPLDAVNKMVGYLDNSDAARDLRQAEGVELFTQATTRYVDNIFEAMFGRVDSVSGEELRVATREGDVFDPNPMARIFGITVRPTRTATERAYSMANMAEFTANERSQIPEYDRLFNTTIAPLLEPVMEELYRSEQFQNGDGRVRREMLKSRLRQVQSLVRGSLTRGPREGGSDSPILSLKRRASQHGTADQRSMALQAMRERFNFDGTVRDMGVRELQYFMNYIDYLDRTVQ